MTLTIDLRDDEVAVLAARAAEKGLSAEQYARIVLEHDLMEHDAGSDSAARPISQTMREIWGGMPEEVRAKLPRDGASQVDHYVYGLPKREQ